ncbi:MAG: hypothetical protein JXB35_07535 [Anaerolineae bacterium]|nr:hypothetical protein [Anaerolineae bacterium]
MQDPITARVLQILEEAPEAFVPVATLYEALARQGALSCFDEAAFQQLLETDERFLVIGGLNTTLVLDEEITNGLEVLSALTGPWALLRSRIDSPLEIMTGLLHHLQEMNRAMEQAWRTLLDAPEAQDNLLSLLMLGDLLERKVRFALTKALKNRVEVEGLEALPPELFW